MFFGVLAHVVGDLHRAEIGPAHGAEVSGFGAFLGKGLVVIAFGGYRVEREIELVFPAEFEASFAQGIVAVLSGRMSFCQVGRMGGYLVSDHTHFDVVLIGKAEVFFGRYVAEHGATVPADHRGSDAGSEVVVARSDIGGQRPKRVEGSFVAPFELLLHVLVYHVHGHVTRAFVHDLAAAFPGSFGQAALDFEFGELRRVVSVGNGTGTQAVADREGHVIGRHDFADLVPIRVEEILLVVGQAPFCHDGTAAGNDTGHALGGGRDEAEQYAGVDGEIIDSLFALLDERVAIDIPIQFFGASADFFEGLVDWNRADWGGAIANDPFAGLVDVLAGGKVHHRIAAPFSGPAHFLDFFFDGGSDRGVADVGIDLHEEVPTDDHRFELRVIDIRGNDRPAASDFGAYEFRSDLAGNVGSPSLARVLFEHAVARGVGVHLDGAIRVLEFRVFANRDVLHLGSDDAFASVVQLSDRLAVRCAERFVVFSVETDHLAAVFSLLGMDFGEVAIVERLNVASFVGFYVAAFEDPVLAKARQAFVYVAVIFGVAPRTCGVVDANGSIVDERAVGKARLGQGDLAHRDAEVFAASLDVYPL